MFKNLIFTVVFCLQIPLAANAKKISYSFPNTGIVVQGENPLFTDPKTGGFTPKSSSFQLLAFEFDQKQPNNLMIKALKKTWENSGHELTSETDISISGFWGQDIRTTQKLSGKLSYTRNIVFGDYYKMAQVSIVCARRDAKEQCLGADALVRDMIWKYSPSQDLKTLGSKIKVPKAFKLYLQVNTKKGPVLMYTKAAEPLSSDSVPSLSFAINKGKLDTQNFMQGFAKSSEMTGINPQASGIVSKRTKDKALYSWGKRPGSNANYYLSCVTLDKKKAFQLMVCATAGQANYKEVHQALFELSRQ